MFMVSKLKQSYVGIVHLFDLKSKKVLLQGSGYFDVENRKLDVTFSFDSVYKDVEWVPILQTEAGYFCPTQSRKGHLASIAFTSNHRHKFSMSSFFHWESEKGIDHITATFDSAAIEVVGVNGKTFTTFSKDLHTAEMVSNGVFKDIEEQSAGDVSVKVKATYSSNIKTIEQRVRFIVESKKTKLSRTNWVSITNAFRLYWLFQHDRTDCDTVFFCLGDSLDLVTDITQLRGFDDGTDIVSPGLPVEAPMNSELLAKTADFFLNKASTKGHGGIEFAFYRLLGYRFRSGPERIGNALLDLVFALDGFCADINKNAQRKLSKLEKEAVRASISKVLDGIEQAKDDLDERVFSFYMKPLEQIYASITRKPYRESVQQCFKTLSMDYDEYEDIVLEVDKVRQIFVHGKGYDTEDLSKKIYTHATISINESLDNNGMEIVFGQTTGLSEKYYKMVRLLFSNYFARNN